MMCRSNPVSYTHLTEVGKAFVGKEEISLKVLLTILAGGHVLLDDIPGVGKTTLALSFSKAMALQYKRIQFTPDVLPSDITGFSIYRKETGKMEYQPGAAICNLLLADEINRASSRTQAALLETMEEGGVLAAKGGCSCGECDCEGGEHDCCGEGHCH